MKKLAAVLTLSILSTSLAAQAPPSLTWASLQNGQYEAGLDVVLVAEPGVIHHCNADPVINDEIVCTHFLRKPVRYQRDDIQEAIARKWNSPRWVGALSLTGIGGGILTGAVYLAMLGPWGIVGAIPVGVIGLMATMMGLFDDTGYGHSPRHIVYVRPGTPASAIMQ